MSSATRAPEDAFKNLLNARRASVYDLDVMFRAYATHFGAVAFHAAILVVIDKIESRRELAYVSHFIPMFKDTGMEERLNQCVIKRRMFTS